MRRYLALTAAATTSMVVLAFVAPLAVLIRDKATQQAVARASLEAQSLVAVLAAVHDPSSMAQAVDGLRQRTSDQITLYLPDGTAVGTPVAVDASVLQAMQGKAFTRRRGQGRDVLVPLVTGDGQTMVVRVGVPPSRLRRGLGQAYALLALVAFCLFGVALFVADRLARFIVRPIDDMAVTAQRLEAGDLAARAAAAKPAEVAAVGHALNRLAQRILDMLASEREALADMSHRLRTPLTALRLEAESISVPDEAARVGASVDALTGAVDELIAQARRPTQASRPTAVPRTTVDLAGVARERARFWSALADDQERPFAVSIAGGDLRVAGSRSQLVAAVDALLGNVFAHTPEGTGLSLTVERRGAAAALTIDDEGPGFEHGAVIERGVSLAGSSGLGLDIARQAAEGSGGTLRLSAAPRGGARVELLVPLAPHGDDGERPAGERPPRARPGRGRAGDGKKPAADRVPLASGLDS